MWTNATAACSWGGRRRVGTTRGSRRVSLVERSFGHLVALVPPDAPGIVFTTRAGGVSTPPFASLNLGYSSGDTPEAVAANRRAISEALGLPHRWVTAHQVHGADVVNACIGDGFEGPAMRRADAIVTRDDRVPVAALAADCVPIALVGDAASGVVHAGWRGLAAGAIAAGMHALRAAGARDVRAWIGPCIGPCHYEVGPEVGEQVARAASHAPSFTRPVDGTTRFDLRAAARWLLDDAGAVVADRDDPPCTWCDPRFYSHRRDRGKTGRQAVIVWRGTL